MRTDKAFDRLGATARNAVAALAVVTVCMLACGSIAFAQPNTADTTGQGGSTGSAAMAEQTSTKTDVSKSEMVYGMLQADGSLREAYVVNRFVSGEPASTVDYGAYSLVSNLSTTQALTCENGKVAFDIGNDPFFYQGTLKAPQLPWNVHLAYTLDGRVVTPQKLAGSTGLLDITVTTSANPSVDRVFYDCFMLQITFTLDGNRCTDIQAENATLAASGKDQTIAFTVLPGHNGAFALTAHVEDFEMPSVQIAALPYSSVIDMPDTSELESGLDDLSSAVSKLNDGTSELADGVSQLSSGAESLADGAGDFGDGLTWLASSSSDIVDASSKINGALKQIADSMKDIDLSNLDDMAEFSTSLRSISQALSGMKMMVQALYAAYTGMTTMLDSLATVASQNVLSDEELGALQIAVSGDATAASAFGKLLTSYYALQQAMSAYTASGGLPDAVTAQLDAMLADDDGLDQIIAGLSNAADLLDNSHLDAIPQLITGLTKLSDEYGKFHGGLVEYTQGVQALSDNYSDLSSGMSELADGTSQLSDGANRLSDGITQLNDATSDLPAQMRERMDELMADYDFPEFDPVSFVDKRNTNVTAVQFVMLTDAIEKPEPEPVEPEPEPEPTIWERFLALFGL